jgi:hypothetical protein
VTYDLYSAEFCVGYYLGVTSNLVYYVLYEPCLAFVMIGDAMDNGDNFGLVAEREKGFG